MATPRILTATEFQGLADMPPELEWFANITNSQTCRAYKADITDFSRFAGITAPEQMRLITRAHVIAWRDALERRQLAGGATRRKLSALASLFNYLCELNAVTHNPVQGVKRPMITSSEGKTPALSDAQARALLDAPPRDTLKGMRDRAIIAPLLYHGIRREELCRLRIKDMHSREGVIHFQIHGKRDKIRYLPINPLAQRLIDNYLYHASHGQNETDPLFQPINNNRLGTLNKPLNPNSIYQNIIRHYARLTKLDAAVKGLCVHSMRATAATNALQNNADITKVQEWLGHSSIATTWLYDRRTTRPEDSPTFQIKY